MSGFPGLPVTISDIREKEGHSPNFEALGRVPLVRVQGSFKRRYR
jgi:hypothetical protein